MLKLGTIFYGKDSNVELINILFSKEIVFKTKKKMYSNINLGTKVL